MGGLVRGIFDLAEGNPTGTEEAQFGQLGKQQIGTGEGLVTPAAGYYEDILSGDPTKIAQTLAPEISAGQTGVEQANLENANFGTRSGGTAASTNAAQAAERGNIINLVGGLQQGAAGAAGSLGTSLEGMGAGNVAQQAQLATQNRQRMVGDVSGIASDVASIASPFLGMDAGGGDAPPILDTTGGTDPLGVNTPVPLPADWNESPGDLGGLDLITQGIGEGNQIQ